MSQPNRTGSEIETDVFSDHLHYDKRINELSREDYQKMICYGIFLAEHDVKDNNLKIIKRELDKDCGKWVQFDSYNANKPDNVGILICAVASYEDYYYLLLNPDREFVFESCVGGYDLIDENNLPAKCSVLDWINKHQQDYIRDIISKKISEIYDVPFTKIYTQ